MGITVSFGEFVQFAGWLKHFLHSVHWHLVALLDDILNFVFPNALDMSLPAPNSPYCSSLRLIVLSFSWFFILIVLSYLLVPINYLQRLLLVVGHKILNTRTMGVQIKKFTSKTHDGL